MRRFPFEPFEGAIVSASVKTTEKKAKQGMKKRKTP